MTLQNEPSGNAVPAFLPRETDRQTPPERNRRIPKSPFRTFRYRQTDGRHRYFEQK